MAGLAGWLPYLDDNDQPTNKTFPPSYVGPCLWYVIQCLSLTLDGDQQLQHVGVGRPGLRALSAPRAEEGDAHLAVLVEVGVEAVGAVAVVVADGRRLRVVGRELEVEEEEAVLVRRARGAHDHHRVEVLRKRE